jgi:DNA-binding CsgD family transcriptional regulator
MQSRELFRHAAEQWANLKPTSHDDAFPLMKQLEEFCDSSTNLYFIDMQADDPLAYALHRIVENVNLRSSSTLLGDYPDQAYMRNDVAPAYYAAKGSGLISQMTLTSRIQDQIATYDRLILPVPRQNGTSAFAVTLSKTRILLPVERKLLTGREEDVLDLLAQGLSSKEIALKTNVSFRTVEHRIASIKTKLQAKNVTHAVAIWMSHFLGIEVRR